MCLVQAFGSLEGRPVSELVEAARRAEVKVREYTPVEGESLEEVDRRLSEFQKSMLRYSGLSRHALFYLLCTLLSVMLAS